MRSSLFRRVTRYPVGSPVDPRENRLTEVTAAVLEQIDGLALIFVKHLLKAGAEDVQRRALDEAEATRRARLREIARALVSPRVQVNTQVATSHGRFIDLEVLLCPVVGAPERGLLIWVEVKHGADLHGDQLDVYLQDMPMRPVPEDVERVVVLLGPRGWTPTAGVLPTEVLVANWQAVGKTVETVETGTRQPEQNWLLSEYIRYLKEEGLSDPDALTTVSALALMEHKTATAAAAGICEYADGVVQAEWGTRGSHKKTPGNTPSPAFGIGYWANYDAHREGQAQPNWREAWFE